MKSLRTISKLLINILCLRYQLVKITGLRLETRTTGQNQETRPKCRPRLRGSSSYLAFIYYAMLLLSPLRCCSCCFRQADSY